jgi:hypothetical protein
VANAFLITPSELLGSGQYIVPDHLDCVKNNNNWKNLEWVTQAENVARALGQTIYGYFDTGVVHKKWLSIKQASGDLGIPESTLRDGLKKGNTEAFIGNDKKTKII